MKLTVDFSALHRAIAPLGQIVTDFSITSDASELESIGSHLNQGMILGKDVQLDEIRIEGHTSSVGLRGSTEAQAYFYNMRLSQGRTRSVLEYGYALMPNESDWIKANIAAVGFSSSRLIKENGVEDAARSRRVSFRAITNADIQIKRILEAQ